MLLPLLPSLASRPGWFITRISKGLRPASSSSITTTTTTTKASSIINEAIGFIPLMFCCFVNVQFNLYSINLRNGLRCLRSTTRSALTRYATMKYSTQPSFRLLWLIYVLSSLVYAFPPLL
jgi:hypothetical protein